MNLKCPVCGKESKQIHPSGFAMEVDDECIEWPEDGELVPTDEKIWCRREKMPQTDEVYTVKVTYPFQHELGEEFQTLFMPAYSYFNGWEERPEEIFKSAIVKCRLEQVLEEHIKHSWVKVVVLEVIPLYEICKTLPAVKYDENVAWSMEEYTNKFEYKCWKYYSWSCQSDVGGWALVFTDEEGVNHLILANDWLMCDTHTYCGNIILEQEVLEQFKRQKG